jgi:hypothetical protein
MHPGSPRSPNPDLVHDPRRTLDTQAIPHSARATGHLEGGVAHAAHPNDTVHQTHRRPRVVAVGGPHGPHGPSSTRRTVFKGMFTHSNTLPDSEAAAAHIKQMHWATVERETLTSSAALGACATTSQAGRRLRNTNTSARKVHATMTPCPANDMAEIQELWKERASQLVVEPELREHRRGKIAGRHFVEVYVNIPTRNSTAAEQLDKNASDVRAKAATRDAPWQDQQDYRAPQQTAAAAANRISLPALTAKACATTMTTTAVAKPTATARTTPVYVKLPRVQLSTLENDPGKETAAPQSQDDRVLCGPSETIARNRRGVASRVSGPRSSLLETSFASDTCETVVRTDGSFPKAIEHYDDVRISRTDVGKVLVFRRSQMSRAGTSRWAHAAHRALQEIAACGPPRLSEDRGTFDRGAPPDMQRVSGGRVGDQSPGSGRTTPSHAQSVSRANGLATSSDNPRRRTVGSVGDQSPGSGRTTPSHAQSASGAKGPATSNDNAGQSTVGSEHNNGDGMQNHGKRRCTPNSASRPDSCRTSAAFLPKNTRHLQAAQGASGGITHSSGVPGHIAGEEHEHLTMSNAGTKETTDITPPGIQADEIRSGGADRRASRNGPISTRMSTHKRQQLLREAEPMGMDGGDSGVSLSDTSRDDDESEAENVPEQCEVKGGHTGTPHEARDVKPTGLTCDDNAESNTSNTRSQLKWMRQGRLRTLPSPRYATLECKKEPKRQMKLAEILAISNPEDTAVSTFLSRMCVLSESTIAGYRRVYDMLSKSRTATLNAPQLCSALQTVCQN